MKDYQIAGIHVQSEGCKTSKIHDFLKKFSMKESPRISENPCVDFSYRSVDAQEPLRELEEKLFGTTRSLGDNHNTGCVCYGVLCQVLEQDAEWTYLLKRELPLTRGFLLTDKSFARQVLVDDCIESSKVSNWEWRRKFRGDGVLDEDNEWIELFLAGFYSFAALHGTMLIHASAVKYQDKAVLFTAPSGTGKTTQAELWKKYVGAEILNGDRVFIRSSGEDEKLYAWGSPWAGSSPYIVNGCAELAAIVVLRQAKVNRIRMMEIPEAMPELSDNSFLPMWDAACLDGMLGVMNRVLVSVPVYMLECRPDEGAVNAVMKEVFKKGTTP